MSADVFICLLACLKKKPRWLWLWKNAGTVIYFLSYRHYAFSPTTFACIYSPVKLRFPTQHVKVLIDKVLPGTYSLVLHVQSHQKLKWKEFCRHWYNTPCAPALCQSQRERVCDKRWVTCSFVCKKKKKNPHPKTPLSERQKNAAFLGCWGRSH